jgi:predicted RNA-binding protein YlqC (UPF0109 family)
MARALVGLTSFLARNILQSDDSFEVDEIEEEDSRHSSIELTVEPGDVAKVFGEDESRLTAIRALLEVRASAIRRTVSLEVLEFEEDDGGDDAAPEAPAAQEADADAGEAVEAVAEEAVADEAAADDEPTPASDEEAEDATEASEEG